MEQLERQGKTTVALSVDGVPTAVFAVADQVKEDSAEAIHRMQELGIQVVMLTGDNEATARAIAGQVGIENVVAQVLPGEKQEKVAALKEEGRWSPWWATAPMMHRPLRLQMGHWSGKPAPMWRHRPARWW